MFEITHQKAQMLLQSAADQIIASDEKSALDAHLKICKECRDYANSLIGLENGLRSTFHAQWDNRHLKLDLQVIMNPSPAKRFWNNISGLTQSMGKVTIAATLVLGYVILASYFGIRIHSLNDKTPTTLPTPNELSLFFNTSPTPSMPIQLTRTELANRDCNVVPYISKTTESLESIATRYGTSKELIMEYNNLTTEVVSPNRELFVPLCKSTPSRTASVPSKLITNTPIHGTILPDHPE
jgi:LysM domain